MKIVFLAMVIFGEAALPMRARGAPETFAARLAPHHALASVKSTDGETLPGQGVERLTDGEINPTCAWRWQKKPIRVEFDLKNNSSIDAEEVAQVYVSREQSALERPALELKGFQRVALGKGEQKRVSILLRRNDMKDWNAAIENWQLEAGQVEVHVGSSSADLRLSQTCTIN